MDGSGAGCGDAVAAVAVHRPSTDGSAVTGSRLSGVAAAPETVLSGPSALYSVTASTVSPTPMSDCAGADAVGSGLDVNAPTFVQLRPPQSTSTADTPVA